MGMSESDVETIFGRSGETVSESQIGGTSLLTRRWEAEDGVAVVSFKDGRVTSKHQFGLK
jgi:hypothetical protein